MKLYFKVPVLLLVLLSSRCQDRGSESGKKMQKTEDETHMYTNSLVNETSPYLLQHAHNPVDWNAWNDETLKRAKDEQKLILVSVGYSACHWCHVMEHESFEDTSVAAIMNEHFICIKVDREERPDIDQVYMDAVQLISGNGGWPLNCFALPDGKPFYGGTYFPKDQWKKLLLNIAQAYQEDPQKLKEYAARLTMSIRQNSMIELKTEDVKFKSETLEDAVEKWKTSFDKQEGGDNRVPKFPLPNNYQFLLRYGQLLNDKDVIDHVLFTLKKMAFGGIYDQAGGGFARYSTDGEWKVPHFEKMLYDNAQLVSLYSEAYRYKADELYKSVVYETVEFVEREMTAPNGAFYSALDADSEGEEGKFYVWRKEEFETVLGEDATLMKNYYNVNSKGLWEKGNYILLRDKTDEEVAAANDLTVIQLREKVSEARKKLLLQREKRPRPGLDDKTLTSWNALMLSAYSDAYRAFGEKRFLQAALKNGKFILEHQLREDGGLNHNYKNGKSTINGYLEDYSFTIEAFLSLYEVTFDDSWLQNADKLARYAITHFYDEQSGMFFFTSDIDNELIARKTEVHDNVIPASNSSMAKALFRLGHLTGDPAYFEKSEQQLKNMVEQIPTYASGYSNWGLLMLHHVKPFYEIAICGNDALKRKKEMDNYYLPNTIFAGSEKGGGLPLLENRHVEGETFIYVCVNKSCKLPVKNTVDAIKLID